MGMKQAIYTSCKTGIEGKSGVCLYSMSESLHMASKKRFEADSIYKKDYKCQLPIEELPLCFFTGVDETGAFYIQQVRSMLDYNRSVGRTGNVLSQMMLFEDSRNLKRPALAYYESPDFRRAMTEEEVQSMNRPEYMPVLEELRPGSKTGFGQICSFIKPEEDGTQEVAALRQKRQEALLHLVAAILRARSEKKTVVVMDTAENIVMWMAAATWCFPLGLNCQLSLSTYAFDPEASGIDLCGYVEGVSNSDFANSRHNYSIVFDMVRFQYPAQDISSGYFNNIKMALLLGGDEYIEQFNTFLDSRGFTLYQEQLYLAYEVYAFLDSGEMVDEARYPFSQVCDFARQWLNSDEIDIFSENMMKQFSARRKAQPEDVKGLVSVMLLNPVQEMTAFLLSLENKLEEGVLAPKLVDAVWNGYIAALYSRNHENMALLEDLLRESAERSAQLLNFRMRHTDVDGMEKFRENLYKTLNPQTGKWSADSEKVLEKYEDFIEETWQGDERFSRELELLGFLLELKKDSQQIQRVAGNVAGQFPLTDSEISEKNKLFRKGRGREYVSVFGGFEVNLYSLADTLLDYAKITRSSIDFARSSLYLAGADLWQAYFGVDGFDFVRSGSLLKEEFAREPIDTASVSVRELREYFQWIKIPLTETVFSIKSFDLLFGAYHMTEPQREMLAGLLMEWMIEVFDKKFSAEEIGKFLYFCFTADSEGYRRVLHEKMAGLKKSELQSIHDYFMQDNGRNYEKNFKLYLDGLCENKQKKGTMLHKLFGRES